MYIARRGVLGGVCTPVFLEITIYAQQYVYIIRFSVDFFNFIFELKFFRQVDFNFCLQLILFREKCCVALFFSIRVIVQYKPEC